MTRAPRCGRVMRRYEKPGRPVLENPVCGRPEGHKGDCCSEAAISTYFGHQGGRGAVRLEERRKRYGRWREAGYSSAEARRRMDWGDPPARDERAA